jgi:DNA polymerase V
MNTKQMDGPSIDLNELLIGNPVATFYLRVSGDSMIDAGIHDNDILVVDKSVKACDHDIIIASLNGEFTVKELRLEPLSLIPHNKNMNPINVSQQDEFSIFGVVVGMVRQITRTK